MEKAKFKRYCWVLGTTSYRVKELREKLPHILKLLNEFMIKNGPWLGDNTQSRFYDVLFENDLVGSKNPNRKAKDSRQITSILSDIGMTYKDRNISPVGRSLLKENKIGDCKILGIDEESLLYLKQLIKYSPFDNGFRPILELIRILVNYQKIDDSIMCYLLPLMIDEKTEYLVKDSIYKIKKNNYSTEEALLDIIFDNDMFKASIGKLDELSVNSSYEFYEEIIPNRKSKQYVYAYKDIFDLICSCRKENCSIADEFKKVSNILSESNSKSIKKWKKLLTNDQNDLRKIQENIKTIFNGPDYKRKFIAFVYKFMWEATLEDYFDLNKRWLSLTDIFVFDNNEVSLTSTAKITFKAIFETNSNMNCKVDFYDDSSFEETLGIEKLPEEGEIVAIAKSEYGSEISTFEDITNVEMVQRKTRFDELVNEKFTDDAVVELLKLCKMYSKEHYSKKIAEMIQKRVTDAATIPAIFEYLVEIAMYKICGKQAEILESINANLDANLLPTKFTSGLKADFLLKFVNYPNVPSHELVMEMTLTYADNQRRAEIESVPRHLAKAIVNDNLNKNDYAIFIGPEIDQSVAANFRGLHFSESYEDGRYLTLGIVPVDVDMFIDMIQSNIKYEELYNICNKAINSPLKAKDNWYEKEVQNRF